MSHNTGDKSVPTRKVGSTAGLNTSSAIAEMATGMLGKTDFSKTFGLNTSSAIIDLVDSLHDKTNFTSLIETIRTHQSTFNLEEIEAQFDQIPDGEALLTRSATEFGLTVPFTHDPVVRMTLQIIVTTIFTTFMLYLIAVAPTTIAVLQTFVSTKTSVETWKAVGAAYDKLYDRKHYHPEKGTKRPPLNGPPSPNNDVW